MKARLIFLVVLLALSGCKSPPPPDIRVGTSYPTCSGSGVPGVAGGHQQAACVNGDAGFVLTASQLSDGGLGVPYFAPSAGGSSSGGSSSGGVSYAPYGSRPAPGHAGVLFGCSDGTCPHPFLDDGTQWRTWINGIPGWEVAPGNSISAFTQVGLTPTSTTVSGGCLNFQLTHSGSNSLSGYEEPKSAGQTLIAHVKIAPSSTPITDQHSVIFYGGIWIRDTSSAKATLLALGTSGNAQDSWTLNVYDFSALNTFSGTNEWGFTVAATADGTWLEIQDATSDAVFSYSQDGVFWTLVGTSTYTPSQGNKFGVGVSATTSNIGITVESFYIH